MNHSKEYIFELLKIIAVNELKVNKKVVDNITMGDSIVDDLGLSSLTIFDFIGHIENTFEVELDERELMKIKTIQDTVNLIYNTLNG